MAILVGRALCGDPRVKFAASTSCCGGWLRSAGVTRQEPGRGGNRYRRHSNRDQSRGGPWPVRSTGWLPGCLCVTVGAGRRKPVEHQFIERDQYGACPDTSTADEYQDQRTSDTSVRQTPSHPNILLGDVRVLAVLLKTGPFYGQPAEEQSNPTQWTSLPVLPRRPATGQVRPASFRGDLAHGLHPVTRSAFPR
ncbi:MAG: hypothetical protein JWP32_1768 [Schumannella sp.]|nr:hypothetical protein [Schumannella sp.]